MIIRKNKHADDESRPRVDASDRTQAKASAGERDPSLGQGVSNGEHHQPPAPGPTTVPKSPPQGPRITFEVVGGDHLRITADWAPGADLSAFTAVLVDLCRGKLDDGVIGALAVHASNVGEPEKAQRAASALQRGGKREGRDEDDPVVCPTQAIRVNMRAFQG